MPPPASEMDRRAANIRDLVDQGILSKLEGEAALAKLKGKGLSEKEAEKPAPPEVRPQCQSVVLLVLVIVSIYWSNDTKQAYPRSFAKG
jgi:hypothetical protein